jgi:hypothetical protein
MLGPSSVSHREKMKLLSIIPISVENLFMRIPDGVLSKKLLGENIIDYIILS